MLAFALNLACCDHCLVYGAEVHPAKPITKQKDAKVAKSAEEKANADQDQVISERIKEIEKLKADLTKDNEKKFAEIEKLKIMSDECYSKYKFWKKLKNFFLGDFLYVFFCNLPAAVLLFAYIRQSDKLFDEYLRGYDDGTTAGMYKGYEECSKNRDFYNKEHCRGINSSVEANIKKFFDQTKRVLSFEAFKGTYKRFFKDGSNADKFYKDSGMEKICQLANNIQDEMNIR